MKLAIAFLAGCLGFTALSAKADSKGIEVTAAQVRASSCQTCHGPRGDSADPTVPRLNGQLAPYIFARLHSMRYPIREAPRAIHNMGDIAPGLDSQVIAAIANYYAVQSPTRGHLTNSASAEGERIYKRGAGKDVPACQNCHGMKGQGGAGAPRLAGQHREYLALQLQAFAMGARIGDPMNHHVWQMPSEQMQAIASYLGAGHE